jgi:hypothetical protein
MFWSTQQKKKQRSSRRNSSHQPARRLRFEPLEDRRVLAAGLVDVQIFPMLAPGELNLEGDGSNNEVRISQTVNVGTYRIDGLNGTLLQINGAGVTMPTVTVNGITGDISVDLLAGNDTFTFDNTYAAGGQDSNVPINLEISNDDGSNVNTISDVMINGDLLVTKNPGSTGYSELHIINSTVIGFTVVDNTGGGLGGDTWTEINNSWLQGNGGPSPAFVLTNAEGKDINDILGNSQFGIGPFPLLTPVVDIDNAGGGSRTTFTGASATAGFGTTTVYGDLLIDNGANVPGTLDIVTFNGSNILGDVDVTNGGGDTSTTVTNSTLGSHLVAPPFSPVIGSPLTVRNDAGFDQFAMTQSSAPWGLLIDNDISGNNDVWGSVTQITGSQVGTGPFGPDIPGFFNAAMVLRGDNGRDLVNVNATQFGGTLDLGLFAGNNEVNLTNRSTMAALNLVTLGGNDSVLIDDSTISVVVYVRLGFGADRFIVTNVDPATEWPSALLGSIDINAEAGVDTTNLSALALGALGFEIFV